MADTTAASSSTALFNWLQSLSPAVIALASLLTGAVAGGTGYGIITRSTTLPAAMADQPRPSSIVSVSDVDHIVSERCNGIGGKLDEILLRFPAKRGAVK